VRRCGCRKINQLQENQTVASNEQDSHDRSAADRKADVIGILVIFSVLVLMALHFVSGWTF
jgi:hypothetical protein